MRKIQIINGPNLNMLGVREPGIYGHSSFEAYLPKLQKLFPDVELCYYQSNIEGELINKMQEVGFSADCAGIVLHCPVVEVHISNVHQREEYRHKSMISAGCKGVICGFGLRSYELAVRGLLDND